MNLNVLRSIALTLVGSATAAVAVGAELQATGVVTPLGAEFSIPAAHEGPWRWARTTTLENALEYRWEVSVKNRAGEYQFGFSFYKFPESKEGVGTLSALLNAGQASLWKLESDGGASLVENARVSATAVDGRVVVRLSDLPSVRLLFGERPSAVKAFSRTPERSESHDVSVEYRKQSR